MLEIYTRLIFVCASILAVLSIGIVSPVQAIEDPLAVANNRVGIHITDAADLEPAAELVNSNGGDWGYVTLVIREDERELQKWQPIFDRMRELHLIPIVRLATRSENSGIWQKPKQEEVDAWVEFLTSLNWVIQNRYVILFNEPNHAKEWGGSIQPAEFARITRQMRDQLKAASKDFFVMPGSLDLSASNTATTMHPADYYKAIHQAQADYFTQFDGWAAHAYPNPEFSGKPTDMGRNTVQGFLWEKQLLQQYGLPDTTPIFITETGWIHNAAKNRATGLSPETIGQYLETAYQDIWADAHVVAVTPFILRYLDAPFEHFSWMNNEGVLPHYSAVQALAKEAGQPKQEQKSRHIDGFLPTTLTTGSQYRVGVRLLNTGQTIWEPHTVRLSVAGLDEGSYEVGEVERTKPGDWVKIWLTITTAPEPQEHQVKLQLQSGEELFGEEIRYQFVSAAKVGILTPVKLWIQRWVYERDFIGSGEELVA